MIEVRGAAVAMGRRASWWICRGSTRGGASKVESDRSGGLLASKIYERQVGSIPTELRNLIFDLLHDTQDAQELLPRVQIMHPLQGALS